MYKNKPGLHERQKTAKKNSLRTISLDITPKCNMACEKCYADTFMHLEPVSIDAIKNAADQLYQMGVYHYVFQGGEPIVDPDRLEAILKICYPEESYYNVVSNGWAMTRDMVMWLKELHVDKIAFSLDSGIEEEHDEQRKKGSFKRVVQAIDNVLDAGLFTSISTVVTRQSLYSQGFKKAMEFAKSRGIRLEAQIAEPVGKWDGNKDILIRPEDAAYIKKLQAESPVLGDGQKMIKRDIYSGELDHCPAVVEFMAITAGGHVLPCNFLQFSLGNIKDKKIKDMRDLLLGTKWFDGSHPCCLCGEDSEFIKQFIDPFVDRQKPMDAVELFVNQECGHGQRI